MVRKAAVVLLTLMLAVGAVSCTEGKGTINMDGLKKFVQDMKKNGKMDYDKTKKAYKSVMPNIDMK